MSRIVVSFACIFGFISAVHGKEFHVATGGNDANPGTRREPLRTIQKAADLAQPGDVITVHAGLYRERINPPRGGESDSRRITYQTAAGEKVEIRGSEVVRNWVKVRDDVYKVTLPNSFFGGFNPYANLIAGDWFNPKGREHHTGAVYLNGEWLSEAATLDEVLKPVDSTQLWFGSVDKENTTIWARFKGVEPNSQLVEINVRQTVFYPDKPGRNYITVRGFIMRHAATPWAPPTAEQVGLIGTHWSKGWIIENNEISHSRCSGVTLGKYGDQWDNTSANSAEGYVKTIERALANGWSRETIGHHIVHNNTIHDCEQTGICGSLGAVFSQITNNHIYNIWVRRQFTGAEMAGIKIHASIDMLIKNNRIHNAGRGMWMDWMAQGTRITGNLCYDNSTDDLFVEVDHGPFLVDNNLFLSGISLFDMSEGGAFAHNLMNGQIVSQPEPRRDTPWHPPHSTAVAGLINIRGGDHRFFNNILFGDDFTAARPASQSSQRVAGFGLWVYDSRELPLETGGNVYYNGARPYTKEEAPGKVEGSRPRVRLMEEGMQVFIQVTVGPELNQPGARIVTSALLGKALVSQAGFENSDGSPLAVDTDYFGRKRDTAHPTAGPFEAPGKGQLKLKVW
jgi:hypothetical protein